MRETLRIDQVKCIHPHLGADVIFTKGMGCPVCEALKGRGLDPHALERLEAATSMVQQLSDSLEEHRGQLASVKALLADAKQMIRSHEGG